MKITKKEWYAMGGFANPKLYRKWTGKCWAYYKKEN